METCKIFISYAREDEAHRVTLGKHLLPLERERIIQIWHDRMITGGREWAGVIAQELANADIVLLLISADFLNSEYCNDVELAEAIRFHDLKQTRVVPVILRSCHWEQSNISRFSALPLDGAPAVESQYPDKYFKEIVEGIRKIVEELQGESDQNTDKPKEVTAEVIEDTTKDTQLQQAISISKIKLFDIEIGLPFSFRWPPTRRNLIKIGLTLLGLIIVAIGTLYFFVVYSPMLKAQAAMRMARYDEASKDLRKIPSWLSYWPTVQSKRNIAKLGEGFYGENPDGEILGRNLQDLRRQLPNDSILLVLDATYYLRKNNFDESRKLALQALKFDEQNAEAWFLLCFISDLRGDIRDAIEYYGRATKAAPNSPQYRSNLAHTFLDQGNMDKAIDEYRSISQFPLARLDQALAHWAKGEIEGARDVQQAALNMLADSKLMMNYSNRRDWCYRVSGEDGICLATLKDKLCYAELEKAASGLLGKSENTVFPPKSCDQPTVYLRKLVAADLCRFVDGPQPRLVETAKHLRQTLGQPASCPAPKHALP